MTDKDKAWISEVRHLRDDEIPSCFMPGFNEFMVELHYDVLKKKEVDHEKVVSEIFGDDDD